MATRIDVAKLAGVSEATVSYVMNDTKNVTPEVRQRVTNAIEELNYRPNLIARSLSTKQTRHVAMLVDSLKNPHYCEMLEGAQYIASQFGYIVSVLPLSSSGESTVVDLIARGVDGAILTLVNNEHSNYLVNRIPCVTSDGNGYATVDYHDAIFNMVECLKREGHRHIAFLSGIPLAFTDPRYTCFREALEHYGLQWDLDLAVFGDERCLTNEAAGEAAAEILLARGKPFSAIFALNDLMAIGAAHALRRAGMRIPEDVSLIGCDHLRILDWLNPGLSTLEVYSFKTGEALMNLLLDKINGRPKRHSYISAEFLRKESIGPAKTLYPAI